MATTHLGLGSNLGDRIANLRQAIQVLSSRVEVIATSEVYESEPHGVEGKQPRYLNMALAGRTDLAPQELLEHLRSIEQKLGRMPDTHNNPRPIDLDILLYEGLIYTTPELTIPHPRMHERAFVLAPLSDIAPHAVHPVFNTVVAELEDMLGDYTSIVWLAEERL